MRHLAFIGTILVLAALQSALGQAVHLDLARPLLSVSIVFYFALHLNTIEGALLTAAAGLAADAAGGYVTGLATFTLVFLFVATRVVLAGLRGEGTVFDMFFSAGLAGAYHAVTLLLARLFGPTQAPLDEIPWVRAAAWSALATAICTPFVLAAARRVDRIGARSNEVLSS